MGIDIERRTPKLLVKMLDPVTGEIFINNISIKRSIWARMIPVANMIADEAMKVLIPSQSVLARILNVTNALVLDTTGDSTKVIVSSDDGTEETVLLSNIAVTFGSPDTGEIMYFIYLMPDLMPNKPLLLTLY